MPEKVEKIVGVFESDKKVGMVFTNALVVDENLKPYPQKLWHYFGFDDTIQRIVRNGRFWTILGWNSYVTGATMAFHSRLRDMLYPFPKGWVHDEWITFVADLTSRIEMIPEPLIKYRRHSNQQIGVKIRERSAFVKWRHAIFPDGHRSRCKFRIERIGPIIERIMHFRDKLRDKKMVSELENYLAHWRFRFNLPKSLWKKHRLVQNELMSGRYRRYSGSGRIAIKDLFDI
ncbi:hypothetical protein SDC9_113206 [bioreactor metagenome]|uniref:Glycosyltransferase 2-like domain-containing protein n=1 Tax=bioreactor metagenome TaxID=1076179 RepID=A0A645BLF5_9ZZZZ